MIHPLDDCIVWMLDLRDIGLLDRDLEWPVVEEGFHLFVAHLRKFWLCYQSSELCCSSSYYRFRRLLSTSVSSQTLIQRNEEDLSSTYKRTVSVAVLTSRCGVSSRMEAESNRRLHILTTAQRLTRYTDIHSAGTVSTRLLASTDEDQRAERSRRNTSFGHLAVKSPSSEHQAQVEVIVATL